jgi:RNA polymerase sigma-70 factor (ECF subfamily)
MKLNQEYSEDELLRMLKGKKRQQELAFTKIYNQYSQRVYAYCLRILGSSDDANDIFQETFLSFYKEAQKDKEITHLNGLIIRIARNLCLNFKRSNSKLLNIEDFEFSVPHYSYEDKELLDIIANALELLDFEFREAFVLRQYQGLPYSEIAEIVGVKESTAKNRCWRAKEKIKKILQPYMKDIEKNQG